MDDTNEKLYETVVKNLTPIFYNFENESEEFYRLMVKSATVGDPEHRDLGKDYFKTTTDWGDQYVKTIKVFIDHVHNDLTNDYMFPAKQHVGRAHVVPKDDAFDEWLAKMGLSKSEALHRWYLVELDKSNEYNEYVMRLANEKRMGLSTQAYRGGVIRQKDGGLDRWWENEITFTVQPMDKSTVGYIFDLAKSFHLPVFLKKDLKMADAQENEVVVEAGTEVTPVTPTPAVEASLEGAIDAIINKTEEADNQDVENVSVPAKMLKQIIDNQEAQAKSLSEMKDMYSSINASVSMWADLEELPQLIAKLQALVGAADNSKSLPAAMEDLSVKIGDVNKGIIKFAEFVVQKLQLASAEEVKKLSLNELEAKKIAEQKKNVTPPAQPVRAASYFPPEAPGA